MKRFALSILVLLLTILGVNNSYALDRYISVTATGTIKVTPDAVRINASTFTIAESSSKALSATASASNKLRSELSDLKINKSYIKSNALSVYPEYNFTQDKGSTLIGYKATQTFEIIVRNTAAAGSIVDSLVTNVGNSLTIDGVSPFIYDQTVAYKSARIDAVKRAIAKAKSYANLLQVNLGKLIYLEESMSPSPTPVMEANSKSDSGTTIIDLGTQDVSVTVSLRWSIN
jgi:uncharacterized protein